MITWDGQWCPSTVPQHHLYSVQIPDHLKRMMHADTMINLDITTICQGLSLVSNDYIDAGACWHDYGDLSLFSLNSADTHWRIGPSGLRNRPYASLSLEPKPQHRGDWLGH